MTEQNNISPEAKPSAPTEAKPSAANTSANNKRIAKNTMMLYFRMLIMMVVGLYTSRVILNALGVVDFGLYNVVGGVVAMFSVLSGSLSAAISRFITFELGRNDHEKLKKVFCSSVNVQIILSLVIILLLETIGLWFLNNKLVIPEDRLTAANWVFQFSIITFAINLCCVPYNACIIAHEKMSAFAYISLLDAFLKLLIAFLIIKNPIDRLVYYGALILVAGLIIRFIYTIYCKKHFAECVYHFSIDKQITKKIFAFAGWNFIGASSAILRDQGGNILINLFFGPTVNAAKGICMSVNQAVSGFVSNFMTAVNPQITKSYATGNYDYMFKLAFQGARLSYYILFLIALPIMFTAPFLLKLWLGDVPDYASSFTVLVLIFTLSESLAGPLITIMLATGNIRNYQIIVGGCQLMNLPFSYVLLLLGFPPETIFYVAIAISVLCELTRLIMLKQLVHLPIRRFLKEVYFNVIFVSAFSVLLPLYISTIVELNSAKSFLIIAFTAFVSASLAIYTIGLNKHDREIIKLSISKLKNKFK